ncbi:MAG: hypothetical protein R3B93_00370 [Bacteroidia bacterium]
MTNEREDPIQDEHKGSLMSKLIAPVNGGYYSMAKPKMANDYLLELSRNGTKVGIVICRSNITRIGDNPASLAGT